MKIFNNFFKYILELISRCIYLIVPGQFRQVFKEVSVFSLIKENTTKECYEHFKIFFKTTVLFTDLREIRNYAIVNAISNNEQQEGFYLEFGVWKGESANFFSKYVKKLYAFDSFEGLIEDWLGSEDQRGSFNLNKKIPKLNSNIEPIVGVVQDTLDNFIEKHNPKINFVHLDMDTYLPTKYALERLKPFLNKGAIIIFDELYNYPGWEGGEYKALREVFEDDEYIFKAFMVEDTQVVIQIT
jgi:hypothetical protein